MFVCVTHGDSLLGTWVLDVSVVFAHFGHHGRHVRSMWKALYVLRPT